MRAASVWICACVIGLATAGCSQGDRMARAKEQLVDISHDYMATDHPDWADQCDGEIVVVERVNCWEVHFPLRADSADRTAVVRIAKGTMEPLGMFHE